MLALALAADVCPRRLWRYQANHPTCAVRKSSGEHWLKRKVSASSAQWWQSGVIYQIYPRSFQDTNGDGIGDLKGIECRLNHLVELGVDAIWLSPIFPSPMADFGYDVAGLLRHRSHFRHASMISIRLLAKAHGLGLKLILDYVPNHTSDQHPWFVESRSSRSSRPKRDWYIWRDPPNPTAIHAEQLE